MFQFRRFPTYAYLIQRTLTEYCSAGFPHSEISGSMLMCSSPQLIAACHVLLRLLMPRHSPCALSSLTSRRTVLDSLKLVLITNYAGFTSCSVRLSFCYPFTRKCPILKFHKFCYLSVACSQFLACFTVQFSRCRLLSSFKTRLKYSDLPKHFNLFLVEVTGLEPVTPCLQSRCSTS